VQKKYPSFLLALLSGILLSVGWPPVPACALLFIGFVPLFIILEQGVKRGAFLGYCFIGLLTWNGITTWWMWNSTAEGSIAAIIANCLLMCIPWLALYNVRKRMGVKAGYIAFALSWLSFEYIHLNWELSWPWLTLGNGFANMPNIVQWYELTGTSGGSAWILFMNIGFTYAWVQYQKTQEPPKRFLLRLLGAGLVLPITVSLVIGWMAPENRAFIKGSHEIVIVQPNIDPYAKFNPANAAMFLDKLVRLSEAGTTPATQLIVWPETAINLPYVFEEDSIRQKRQLEPLWRFLAAHPQIRLVSGIEGYKFYTEAGISPHQQWVPGLQVWVDAYNTAALLDSGGLVAKYHKSKLVPGVETLPSFLRFMAPWFEQFGGTTGGYAPQKERTVLVDSLHHISIAPAICYESIYGEFMTGFIRNGANLICIITNDGWWGNTAGHKQHLAYARLRAIESRRWVVRSANTGISAVINPMGTITQKLGWEKEGLLTASVPTYNRMTFYARYGDLISKAALLLTFILVGYSTLLFFRRKR